MPRKTSKRGKKQLFAGYKEVLIEIQHTCGKKEILFRESLQFFDGNSMIEIFKKTTEEEN